MQVQKQADLSSLNTLQLCSTAELMVDLFSPQDLLSVIQNPQLKSLKWNILGGGSNLVLPSLIQGLVLRPLNQGQELLREDADHWFVKAQAGTNWHDFVQWTLQQGFYGLENLSLIPGTVGAAPIQNIGAYGVEVKDTLWEVHALDLNSGQSRIFQNSECHFSYRDSFFKQEGAGKYLIWEVIFKLPKKHKLHLDYGDVRKELEKQNIVDPTPRDVAAAVISLRQSKLPDPKVIGNAGSFFKNPIVSKAQREDLLKKFPDLVSYPYLDQYKLAAGWLIDRSGWKGKKLGPVGMYEKQALVLVNHGGGNAEDVLKLAREVAKDVKERFGVLIEPEPIQW